MVLEDLEGQGVAYLHEQVQRFQEAASRRPEIALCIDMMMADMPQKYVNLDKEKCKFHKVDIDVANGILASYNGSSFINYFNAFGQQWQVYIQAQGEDRSDGLNQNGNDEQEFQHEAYRFQLSVSGARMFRRFSIWP